MSTTNSWPTLFALLRMSQVIRLSTPSSPFSTSGLRSHLAMRSARPFPAVHKRLASKRTAAEWYRHKRQTERVSSAWLSERGRCSKLTHFSTPFGLYRDGTELRGVYYSKPEVARAACLS